MFVTVPYVSPTVHYTAKLRPVRRGKAQLKSAFDTSKRCQAQNCSASHIRGFLLQLNRDFCLHFLIFADQIARREYTDENTRDRSTHQKFRLFSAGRDNLIVVNIFNHVVMV